MEGDLTLIHASGTGADLIFIFMSSGYVYWLEHWIHWSKVEKHWLKNTGWLQGWLSLSFFGDRPNEYQELLGTLCGKKQSFSSYWLCIRSHKGFFFNNGNNIQSLEPHQSLNTEKIWHMFCLNCWFVTKRRINGFFGDRVL